MGIQFEQSEVGNDGGRGRSGDGIKQENAGLQQPRTVSASVEPPSVTPRSEPDLSESIGRWLRDVEKFGFINNIDKNQDERDIRRLRFDFLERKLPTLCICDPFSGLDVQDADLDLRVESLHDGENRGEVVKPGDTLVGELSLAVTRRSSRYILRGRWRKGLREGRGSVSGPGLEANFGVSDIVGRYRRGRLEGWCVTSSHSTFTP